MVFRLIFFIFSFIVSSQLFGQTIITDWPGIEDQSQPNAKITKVELTERYTIVWMTFKNNDKQSAEERQMEEFLKRFKGFDNGGGFSRSSAEINFDPKSRLIAGKKRFAFIKAAGIPTNEKRAISNGEKVAFKVYFERLDPGIETFDLYEGKDAGGLTFWNFNGIHIKNPLVAVDKSAPLPATNQPTSENVTAVFAFNGLLLDAKTQLPINGKITCTPGFRKVLDSTSTKETGGFRFSFKAGQTYVLNFSANGYATLVDSFRVADNQTGVLTKSFYLTPIQEGQKVVLNNVYFKTSEAVLLPESFTELDKLATQMTQNPQLQIRVEGHTDAVGDPVANLELSKTRAEAVKEYLVSKGVETDRIETKGFGSSRPLVKSDNARQQNRRVEFVITKI